MGVTGTGGATATGAATGSGDVTTGDVTITVSNTASVTVPAESFGPGRVSGTNAVDAFNAAVAAANSKNCPTGSCASVNTVVNSPAQNLETHRDETTKTPSKPKTAAAKGTDRAAHAEELEKLHSHMHEAVKNTATHVRASAKKAIGAAVDNKEQVHAKEEKAAKAGREEGAGLVGDRLAAAGQALMKAHGSQQPAAKSSASFDVVATAKVAAEEELMAVKTEEEELAQTGTEVNEAAVKEPLATQTEKEARDERESALREHWVGTSPRDARDKAAAEAKRWSAAQKQIAEDEKRREVQLASQTANAAHRLVPPKMAAA